MDPYPLFIKHGRNLIHELHKHERNSPNKIQIERNGSNINLIYELIPSKTACIISCVTLPTKPSTACPAMLLTKPVCLEGCTY